MAYYDNLTPEEQAREVAAITALRDKVTAKFNDIPNQVASTRAAMDAQWAKDQAEQQAFEANYAEQVKQYKVDNEYAIANNAPLPVHPYDKYRHEASNASGIDSLVQQPVQVQQPEQVQQPVQVQVQQPVQGSTSAIIPVNNQYSLPSYTPFNANSPIQTANLLPLQKTAKSLGYVGNMNDINSIQQYIRQHPVINSAYTQGT